MKPQEEHSVDKTFRRLLDYEVQPSDEVWNAVQEALHRRKGKRLLWIRLSAAAAILAFAVLFGYYLGRQSQPLAVDLPQKNHQSTTEVSTKSFTASSGVHPLGDENTLPDIKPDINKAGIDLMNLENSIGFPKNQVEKEKRIPQIDASFPFLQRKEPAMASAAKWGLPGISEKLLLASLPSDEGIVVEAEEKNQTAINRNFAVGGWVGPVLAYRDVHARNTAVLATASGVSASSKEQPLTTYAGSLQLYYQVSKRLSIGTGLGYSGMGLQWKESFSLEVYSLNGADILQNKESVAYTDAYFAARNSLGNIPSLEGLSSNLLTSGVTAERSLSELQFTQQLGYVEIPLVVKYAVLDRRLGDSLSTGILNHFLVRN